MQSLGFVETQGYVPAFAVADAMVKAANVEIVKKVWIGAAMVTIIVRGEVGAVRTAVDAGAAAANKMDALLSCYTIARPTVGYIPAVAAADSMVKAADVKLVGCEVIGGGYVTVAVAGEIGAIRTAVDAGAAAAKQAGQLHCAHVIARPAEGAAKVIGLDLSADEKE